MKALTIFFIFIAWTLVRGVLQSDLQGTPIVEFPTFDVPDFQPQDLSGGCASFTDCIEFLAYVLLNGFLVFIFLGEFITAIFVYIIRFILLIVEVQFSGIPGAPPIINILLTFPFFAMIGLIIFNSIRSGKTASD